MSKLLVAILKLLHNFNDGINELLKCRCVIFHLKTEVFTINFQFSGSNGRDDDHYSYCLRYG